MILNPNQIASREKQVLAGLFLSKFDQKALASLGFDNFTEAFNALGYGLGGRPASIKNYRDEFDPIFPNARNGWRNRKRRDYCMKIEEDYRDLALVDFAKLVASFVGTPEPDTSSNERNEESLTPTSFAKRLITGRAAEQYFQAIHSKLLEFEDCELEDTTSHGCGYDFRLWPKTGEPFKAVEVKGLADQSGWLSLTDKEHETAIKLKDRFFLFVVKNFREKPFHEVHADPISGPLTFERKERLVPQVSWAAAA